MNDASAGIVGLLVVEEGTPKQMFQDRSDDVKGMEG
jgi:hypothetical protein